jgi:hypothetical protein
LVIFYVTTTWTADDLSYPSLCCLYYLCFLLLASVVLSVAASAFPSAELAVAWPARVAAAQLFADPAAAGAVAAFVVAAVQGSVAPRAVGRYYDLTGYPPGDLLVDSHSAD